MAIVLLDTNVFSEIMKPAPDPQVEAWMDQQTQGNAWISAITVAEIRTGIALLPDGKRRSQLAKNADRALGEFDSLCISFDALAANDYARLVSARRKRGRPIGYQDAQIAAIARTSGLTLATRNTGDFADIDGLTLVDPWKGGN